MNTLPPPTAAPCKECPWRRAAVPGHLGPYSAETWCRIAHGESAIACHLTIKDTDSEGHGDWEHPAMRQCRGAAIFRENVLKSPRNPEVVTGPTDTQSVFATNDEFIEHHTRRRVMQDREVSIGGHTDKLIEEVEHLLEQLRSGQDAALYVKGNGNTTPGLNLYFTREDMEWKPDDELLVDYA